MNAGISLSEYEERRDRVVRAAAAEGLDALLVCARGGGTLERYADIFLFESAICVVEAAVPGATGEATMQAGSARQAEMGFERTCNFQGFGIGLGWDDPWLAPGVHMALQPGMVICVEKWLMRDGYAGDFEHTVLVTPEGTETITDARMRWW
jgi:hypothetical protein